LGWAQQDDFIYKILFHLLMYSTKFNLKIMYRNILILIISLLSLNLYSQHLACFSDQRYNFYVFDAGNVQKVENLQVWEYQIGGICIAYLDNAENLKVYYNGKVEFLESGGSSIRYNATDYLLGYKQFDFLKVFDRGQLKVLSTAVEAYSIQDSLIAWYDKYDQNISVYYKGETIVIEEGLLTFPIDFFEGGDNILAYRTTISDLFKVFYHGEVIELDNIGQDIIYKAGRDIVAYYDISRSIFKVFYKGEVFELEYFQPKSFKVGDEMVVYVDHQDNFKLFDRGITYTILTYPPTSYRVQDRVFTFQDSQAYLKTYCDGVVQVIEPYIPTNYKLDWETIAFIDNTKFVGAVQNCEKFVVTYEPVLEMELIRNLILYKVGHNTHKIYYFGQTFEYSY